MNELHKVKCKLVGIDGNAFSLMGHFAACARKCKWSKEDIDKVLKEAMSSDYDHLLITLASYCENSGV